MSVRPFLCRRSVTLGASSIYLRHACCSPLRNVADNVNFNLLPLTRPPLNLSVFLARRFLTRQQGAFSGFIIRLAAAATALSVAVMIVAVAVVTGFQGSIEEKLFGFWGHVHIAPYNPDPTAIFSGEPVLRDERMMQKVARMDGVVQVQPFALRPGILRTEGALEGVQLKGVEKSFRYPPSIKFSGGRISYPDSGYALEILLSESTAARLSVKAGDAVRLYFFEPGSPSPRIRKLSVAGLWRTGMEDVDRGFALCDLRLLQRLAGFDSTQISGYQIELADPGRSTEAADRIYREAVQPPLTTRAIPELYAGIFDWLRLQNINVRVLLSIMAAIALINLCAALLILLVDRTRAVGLFKALGQGAGSISAVFVWLAGLVGAVGVLLGNILGLGLCWMQQALGIFTLPEETYYMRQVPVSIVWWHIALIDVTTLLACFLCLWLPALYVRRIHPVRALGFR